MGLVWMAVAIGVAGAHTTSIGYVPGSTTGSVTFWTGSYSHGGGAINEGTATLTGVSVTYNQVVNFNIAPVAVKPVGLVDGTNNFFWGPSPYPFPVSVDPVLFGGVVVWQGVGFTGLVPGTYTFTCGGTCGVTAQWQTLPGASGTITVNLTGSVIGGGGGPPADIPTTSEWSLFVTALMLLVAGMLALRLRR